MIENVINMEFSDEALKMSLDFKSLSEAKAFFGNEECINKVLSIIEDEEKEMEQEKEFNDLFDSLSAEISKIQNNVLDALYNMINEERINRAARD